MDLARNENDRIYALTSMADPLFTHEREAFEEIVKNYAEENGIVVEEHLFCEIEGFNNIGDSIENFVNFHEEIAFDYVLVFLQLNKIVWKLWSKSRAKGCLLCWEDS